jgi:hypothetical protein
MQRKVLMAKSNAVVPTKKIGKELEAVEGIDSEALAILAGSETSGFENVGSDGLLVPLLKIAQPLSQGIGDDLSPGEFYNSATQKSYGKTLKVIFLGYYKCWTRWGAAGLGDYKGVYTEQDFVKKGIEKYPQQDRVYIDSVNQEKIKDTRNLICFLPDFPGEGLIIWPLSATGISHCKRILSQASALRIPGTDKQAPLFSSVYEFTTEKNSNDRGSWYMIGQKRTTNMKRLGWATKEFLSQAATFVTQAKEYIARQNEIKLDVTDDTIDGEDSEF